MSNRSRIFEQGTEPRRREYTGPKRRERSWNERWMRGLRRWKWPMMGKAKGLGGRWFTRKCFEIRKAKTRKRMNRTNSITMAVAG